MDTTTRKARILPEGEGISALDSLPVTTVKGANLRPGMILLDDLDCPVATVDHRIGSSGPRTGAVDYLVLDLEGRRGWYRTSVHRNAPIRVAAA